MALEDKKIPYEILIRFGTDGAPQGAHVQYRRRVVLDGEVLKDDVLDAEPLGLVDFPTSGLLSDVAEQALTTINSQSLALAQAATTETGLRDELSARDQAITDLNARITEAARRLALAETTEADLRAEIAQRDQEDQEDNEPADDEIEENGQ